MGRQEKAYAIDNRSSLNKKNGIPNHSQIIFSPSFLLVQYSSYIFSLGFRQSSQSDTSFFKFGHLKERNFR
ncbi:hypothetical protein, partial [Alistipes putredinis]|uniref:hypothetical protein n=1 Tax=Alistipes putredinis TaxID=28117 RepID=UPI003AB8EAE7